MTAKHYPVAMRDYSGQVTRAFRVTEAALSLTGTKSGSLGHHGVIIDRSGSMWSDMESVKSMVEKVFVLDEFAGNDTLTTLISYSSTGDVTKHWARVPISEVMKPGSRYIESLRQMRSTGLTCISQAVKMAIDEVRPGEATILTLHSDGYANDSGPAEERRKIEAMISGLKGRELDLAIDTVAYSDRSDFRLLLSIAEQAGGHCVVAKDVKAVYDALLATTKRLVEGSSSPIVVPAEGADLVLFVSKSAKKILLSEGSDLVVRGLKPEDHATVYRLKNIDIDGLHGLAKSTDLSSTSGFAALYALSSAFLSQGKLTASKHALVATADVLAQVFWRALSKKDVEAMHEAVTAVVFGETENRPRTTAFGISREGPIVAELFSVIAEHKKDLLVNIVKLAASYRLRSVRKIPGSRDETGKIVPPEVTFTAKDSDAFVAVSGVQISNTAATLNLRLVRDGVLADAKSGKPIEEVAGVDLTGLKLFRNYTIVADGEVFAPQIELEVKSKAAWRALEAVDAVEGPYDHTKRVVTIDLTKAAVVDFTKPLAVSGLAAAVRTYLAAKMLGSVLRALATGRSGRFSDEQISALDAVCVSKSLYVSTPTTVPYSDLTAALNEGSIDVEVGTKVELGLHEMLPSHIPSANAFLSRHYTVTKGGAVVKDAKFPLLLETGVTIAKKELSSKAKPAVSDTLFLPLFDDLFGADNGVLRSFLMTCDFSQSMADLFISILPKFGVIETQPHDADDVTEIIEKAQEKLEEVLETTLGEHLRPLVFSVGATGTLPETLDAPPLDAEKAKERAPLLKTGEKLSDATFYFLPEGVLLATSPDMRYYSTGKDTPGSAA